MSADLDIPPDAKLPHREVERTERTPKPPTEAEGRAAPSLHASCIVIGESGVLIRGASGAGKSSLAAALVAQARREGGFAAWVADDRVLVRARGGRLIAAPHPVIAGRFEARGFGILREPNERLAVVRLVVDLEECVPRLPRDAERVAVVAGMAVRRLPLVARRVGLYETSLVFRLAREPEKDALAKMGAAPLFG